MALDNINTNSLSTSLTNAKNQINYSTSDRLLNENFGGDNWYTDSRETLKDGVGKLIAEYKNLDSMLGKYIGLIDKINKINSLRTDNVNLQKDIDNPPRVTTTEYEEVYNETTKEMEKVEKKVDKVDQAKVDSYNSQKRKNEEEISKLISEISQNI